MSGFKGFKYTDRQSAAAAAREAMLAKFKARPAADDPEVVRLAAERRAVVEARELREAERKRQRAEDAARREAEELARMQAEEEARIAAEIERVRAEKAARDAAWEAARAAARRRG